ncbi:hypothetical protein RhiirC2_752455, partial [Rhizophagus irregularis]
MIHSRKKHGKIKHGSDFLQGSRRTCTKKKLLKKNFAIKKNLQPVTNIRSAVRTLGIAEEPTKILTKSISKIDLNTLKWV